MMHTNALVITIACSLLFARTSLGQPLSPEAILETFVSSTERNLPITGEFRIQSSVPLESFAEMTRKMTHKAHARGLGIVIPLPDNTLHCRWSYSISRELLETLAGSTYDESFLYRNDGNLVGAGPNYFNISGTRGRRNPVRPVSFYHHAHGQPWRKFIAGKRVRLIENTDSDGEVTVVVSDEVSDTARQQPVIYHAILTFDLEDYRLLNAKVFYKGVLATELKIDRYVTKENGMFFPAEARLDMFANGKLVRTNQLKTISVEWPTEKKMIDAAFEMSLPAGTWISDKEHERHMILEWPTSAATVLSGQGDWKPNNPPLLVPGK